MTDTTNYELWIGRTAIDSHGAKIGKIEQIYLDSASGAPAWITVSTGLFGAKQNFAPLFGSHDVGDALQLAVDKHLVTEAPSVDADWRMDDSVVVALYDHYQGRVGVVDQRANTDAHTAGSDQVANTEDTYIGRQARDAHHDLTGRASSAPGRATSELTTEGAMIRSEERLQVGTETVHSGKARLRKYIVEEQVTQTVTLSHEEVYVERHLIDDAEPETLADGDQLSEEEYEIVLHAEQPRVTKETVPVERVMLVTETVTNEEQIAETIRKERIDQITYDHDAQTDR